MSVIDVTVCVCVLLRCEHGEPFAFGSCVNSDSVIVSLVRTPFCVLIFSFLQSSTVQLEG